MSGAEVNLAWWAAWTSNPVGFTGRWARWVRFPCTSATFVFNDLDLSRPSPQARRNIAENGSTVLELYLSREKSSAAPFKNKAEKGRIVNGRR